MEDAIEKEKLSPRQFPDLQRGFPASLFPRKQDSAVIVDTSSNIKLICLELKGVPRISALKIIEFSSSHPEAAVVDSLRDFLKDNSIVQKDMILVPVLKSLLIKRVQLPSVPEGELAEAIKWQLKEDVSFDPAKSEIGYEVVKKALRPDGSKLLDIVCCLAREEELKADVLSLKQAGFSVRGVYPAAFGYAKLLERYFKEESSDSLGILDMSDDNSYIGIYRENKLQFYRPLPVSIGKLKESLESELVTDKGKEKLTPEEVGDLLFNYGILKEGSAYKDKLTSAQALGMLRPGLERLVQEIRRSFDYYSSQFKEGEVRRLWVSGKAGQIPGLESYLKKELGLDIKVLSLEGKVPVASGVDQGLLSQVAGSLAWAFDHDSRVNLLPLEYRELDSQKVQWISLHWIAILVFLAFGISYFFTKVSIGWNQKNLDGKMVQINVLSEVQKTKERLEALDNFSGTVKNSSFPAGVFLKKLSLISPREMNFSELSLDCDAMSGHVSGSVKSREVNPDSLLTKFVTDLNNSGFAGSAEIESVDKITKDALETTSFKITFKLL